jgi:hypothetical protein
LLSRGRLAAIGIAVDGSVMTKSCGSLRAAIFSKRFAVAIRRLGGHIDYCVIATLIKR